MKNYKLKLILAISTAYLAGLTFSYASNHEEYEHQKKQEGHNGGGIVTEVEPHLEFLVTKEPEVQITNQDKRIQVVRFSASQKSDYTLFFLKTKLKNYRSIPMGSHIDVEIYNRKGQLVEKYSKKLQKYKTRRHVRGRHCSANSFKRVEMAIDDIGLIKIHSFTESHDKHFE